MTVMADIEGVEGWLDLEEALVLREAARQVALTAADPVVVEIGSWKGRSTIAMAGGLREAGRGRVFAIDPHRGSSERQGDRPVDTFPEFRENVASRGLDRHVTPVRETSAAARPRFADRSVHMLFVDGPHDYASVRQEIEDWRSALVAGARVAFHDFSWPGVGRALREAVLGPRSEFRQPRLIRNTMHFRYLPDSPWTVGDAAVAMQVRLVIQLREAACRARPLLPPRLLHRARVCSEQLVNGRSWPAS
jgi:predicted O-methyltransferase YrrM